MSVVIDVMGCVNWMCGQARGSNSRGSTNAVCHLGFLAFAFRINRLGSVSLTASRIYKVLIYEADDNPSGDWDERVRDLWW